MPGEHLILRRCGDCLNIPARLNSSRCPRHAVMDYHVKPVGKTCAATGKDLVPGSQCRSVLVEEGGAVTRFDYAEEAWPGTPENAVAIWRFQVPDAEADGKRKPLDGDTLLACFEQMSDDANPANDKLRFVLALLLVQKRRLRMDGGRRDGDITYLQLIGNRGERSLRSPRIRPRRIRASPASRIDRSTDGPVTDRLTTARTRPRNGNQGWNTRRHAPKDDSHTSPD